MILSRQLLPLFSFTLLLSPPSLVSGASVPHSSQQPALVLSHRELGARQSSASWTLTQVGNTGVNAMQLAIVSPTLAIILDKDEHNPLMITNGAGTHPAWGALYNLETNVATPLDIRSNAFCAGGTFISDGTLVSTGGNGAVNPQFGDSDGWQGVRLFRPCTDPDGNGCAVYEDPKNLHLSSSRWYPSALRIADGSAMIIGGSSAGGFYNPANVPTYEFYPSKGAPVHLDFLARTMPANLFPITIALPDGRVFMAANNQSIIWDYHTLSETRLPDFPNGVRITYPFSGSGVLLPLAPPNYTPEVLICGGNAVSDQTPEGQFYADTTQASSQCVRMVITPTGIAAGWRVERMLESRVMPDFVLMPDGNVVIVNGGQTGVAGYGNVQHEVGQSNADAPAFTPSLYKPTAPAGSRFSNFMMPTSNIARLYHSVATLTPNGNIMIAGSNPNFDYSTTKYPTEYRVEYLSPPYMSSERPALTNPPTIIGYGQTITIPVTIPPRLRPSSSSVSLIDLGFITHATHNTNRLVFLVAEISADMETLTITGPSNRNVYPPGPGYVYLTVNGVPSKGIKIMVGSGAAPPQV